MGLFDFVKEAGAKLFGIGETKAEKAEQERVKADALVSQVKTLGLAVESLRIEVLDDVATVFGTVPNQAEKEKIVLLVGNVSVALMWYYRILYFEHSKALGWVLTCSLERTR